MGETTPKSQVVITTTPKYWGVMHSVGVLVEPFPLRNDTDDGRADERQTDRVMYIK